MHVPIILILLWALALISLLVLTTLQYRQLVRARDAHNFLSEVHDNTLLDLQRQQLAARAVVPFLAKTSVAMFYGEQEGVQYSFAQRQEIAGRVQAQNDALREFSRVFGISLEAEAVARASYGDPEAKAVVEELLRVEELGPDSDLPPASSNPWS